MAKKVHMYTKKKGVSCGLRPTDGNMNNILFSDKPTDVTCKACLKKIANEKVWVGKKDIFSTGNILRVRENVDGTWEITFYMNSYEVGKLRKKNGDGRYTSKKRAFAASRNFIENLASDRFRIIED